MDRNIVTPKDAEAIRQQLHHLKGIETASGGGADPKPPPLPTLGNGGLQTDVRPDQWYERLAKFIPAEALSLYIALAGLVSAGGLPAGERVIYFYVILVVSSVFNFFFLKRIWHVRRHSQIVVSTCALLTYVYAGGGQLVEALPFHKPLLGSLVLVGTTAFLSFFPIPQPESETNTPAGRVPKS